MENRNDVPKQIKLEWTYSNEFDQLNQAKVFYDLMNKRRTVREFSSSPIAREVIEDLIKTASTAPSGAHKQPWTFCAISNPEIKKRIREAAEKEEYESYNGRMSSEWLNDLKPLGTNWHKPFLEEAPWLIAVFKKIYDEEKGEKKNNYYVSESVGIACGMLITAIHQCGLATVTHTPSPMNFLSKILNRPDNERAFLLLPIGIPKDDTTVPNLLRKQLNEVAVFHE
jgi:iodotyrosine deiodinase